MRFPLTGWIYWEKTCLNTNSEPCDWICFPKYCFNSEILITAFLFGQSQWIQNAYFSHRKIFPWPSRIKSDASTPSESAVAPRSLQSRTVLSLVRHMSGAAFGTGLRYSIFPNTVVQSKSDPLSSLRADNLAWRTTPNKWRIERHDTCSKTLLSRLITKIKKKNGWSI